MVRMESSDERQPACEPARPGGGGGERRPAGSRGPRRPSRSGAQPGGHRSGGDRDTPERAVGPLCGAGSAVVILGRGLWAGFAALTSQAAPGRGNSGTPSPSSTTPTATGGASQATSTTPLEVKMLTIVVPACPGGYCPAGTRRFSN